MDFAATSLEALDWHIMDTHSSYTVSRTVHVPSWAIEKYNENDETLEISSKIVNSSSNKMMSRITF